MNQGRPRVVVGIDGSDESIAALCWAIGYAGRTAGTVRAVMVWQQPAVHGYPSYARSMPVIADAPYGPDIEQWTRETLAALVNDVVGGSQTPPIQQLTVEGSPASVLVEQSKSADLLAVGARGHSVFTELLLGSVSTHCLHHAGCPV